MTYILYNGEEHLLRSYFIFFITMRSGVFKDRNFERIDKKLRDTGPE